jgi:hypothetical protein
MDDLGRTLAMLAVGTSDDGDDGLPDGLLQVLRALRQHLKMDVVFVSKLADGRRTFMEADTSPAGSAVQRGGYDPIEQSWCHHIVQGRLPELIHDGGPLIRSRQAPYTPLEIGTHLSVPLVLADGTIYGTLCTFAFHVDDKVCDADMARLRNVAKVIAARLCR